MTDPDILVVDDRPRMQQRRVTRIGHWGWSVACVPGANPALNVLCQRNVGCVRTDHWMSQGNGIALAARWALLRDPRTPLLVHPSATERAVLNGYRARGIPRLAKGGQTDLLRAGIGAALALRARLARPAE